MTTFQLDHYVMEDKVILFLYMYLCIWSVRMTKRPNLNSAS